VPERGDSRLTHHDLCFGCGPANLFGLQLELERTERGVEGRFFVKQDHQGPPGYAHGGVLAAALDEAMALLVFDSGAGAVTARLEVDLRAPAPVGTFVAVVAEVRRDEGRRIELAARALGAEEPRPLLAEARGVFVRPAG
jgi:acyl-coenzyme A thioesterase PaaI-like protein